MSNKSLKIRSATVSDLQSIVKTHEESFPDFFLTKMGSKFLKEMYSGYLSHPSCILLVALEEEEVLGFVSGTTSPNIFFSQLRRKRAIYFLAYSLPALFRHPFLVVKKLFSAMFYQGDNPAELKNAALLSSIGVKLIAQGKSVGKNLLDSFEREAFSRGVEFIYLTTDKLDNKYVNQFYGKNGYIVESSFTQNSIRPMLRYIKKRA